MRPNIGLHDENKKWISKKHRENLYSPDENKKWASKKH
jgi:hypothetical protein